MEQFGDARMTAREANAIVQSAFPAAYEWCGRGAGGAGEDEVIHDSDVEQWYNLRCSAR